MSLTFTKLYELLYNPKGEYIYGTAEDRKDLCIQMSSKDFDWYAEEIKQTGSFFMNEYKPITIKDLTFCGYNVIVGNVKDGEPELIKL